MRLILPPAFFDMFPFFVFSQGAYVVGRIQHDAVQYAAAAVFAVGIAFGGQGNHLVGDFNRLFDVLVTGLQFFQSLSG